MSKAYDWQGDVGDVWAEEWRRTDRTLAPVNLALVAEAVAARPARVLEIGCGAGATSLALAEALPDAEVTGVDLSASLVAVARERAGGNPRLRFDVANAASWSGAEPGFDLIVSRHGVMFFEDPVAAFANFHRLSRSGARLVFSCFRDRRENDWVWAMRPIVERFAVETLAAPEPPVGPFAFADPARIESILSAAGFASPRLTPLDFAFTVGTGEDPIADAISYLRRVGPFAALLKTLDEPPRREAIAMLADVVAAHRKGQEVVFGAATWIVRSERP